MNNKSVISYIQNLTQKLAPAYANTHTTEQNAWELLQKATGLSKSHLIIKKELSKNQDIEVLLNNWVKEIIEDHKPIQYILGSVPFLDLTIAVEPPILIPRPETEEWCHAFIERVKKNNTLDKPLKILDLCTGSGCIALAIAQAFPHSIVYASDISPQALALAQKNAHTHNILNVTCIESDLYTNIPKITFDYIVSNPPYITPQEYMSLDTSVSLWEDKGALMANDQGLEIIRKIIEQAPQFLKHQQKSSVWIEIGYRQAATVKEMFHQAGFASEVLKDLFGNDRVITGILERYSTQR